jgi:ABC-2 type transport system permease protein
MTSDTIFQIQKVKAQPGSRSYWAVRDSLVFIKRSLKHIFKNMDQLLGVVLQPIMFMLLFRYVFGGAIDTGGTTYVNFLVAGILVQTAAFGATTTSLSVAADLKRGFIERIKSLPIASSGLLTGHVVADLVRNVLSSFIMILVALLVGFRPTATPYEWLLILGLLLMFTFAVSWLSAIMGLLAKTVEAVQWISFVAVFPLTFASSAFVPAESMPKYLRIFAENQPVTHVIEAMRALMVGTDGGNHMFWATVWCVGAIIISIPLAAYLFRTYVGKA